MHLLLTSILAAAQAAAREITFSPISPLGNQHPLTDGHNGEHDIIGPIDVSGAQYGGLTTYANLPYAHCLAGEGEDVEAYDIAVMGAPFDTVGISSSSQTVC